MSRVRGAPSSGHLHSLAHFSFSAQWHSSHSSNHVACFCRTSLEFLLSIPCSAAQYCCDLLTLKLRGHSPGRKTRPRPSAGVPFAWSLDVYEPRPVNLRCPLGGRLVGSGDHNCWIVMNLPPVSVGESPLCKDKFKGWLFNLWLLKR